MRRAAPFTDPEFDTAWAADGTASVWYWSRSRIAPLAEIEPARRKRFVAEALYAGLPHQDAIELLQLEVGVEARSWKNGKVDASRWWPQSPAIDQWREFLRGSGHSAAIAVPEPTPTPLSKNSWNRLPISSSKLELSGLEQHLPKFIFVSGLLLLLAIGAELGGIVRAQADTWRAQAAIKDLNAPLKRILDAREVTDATSTEISHLLSLYARRPSVSLMAELTRLMPGKDWSVKKWSQLTPDTIEVVLIAPDSNPEALVSTWESSPMFTGVTTDLGRDSELTIKATITPPSSFVRDEIK